MQSSYTNKDNFYVLSFTIIIMPDFLQLNFKLKISNLKKKNQKNNSNIAIQNDKSRQISKKSYFEGKRW